MPLDVLGNDRNEPPLYPLFCFREGLSVYTHELEHPDPEEYACGKNVSEGRV